MIGAGALGLLLLGPFQAGAQDPPPEADAQGLETILWLHGGPPRDAGMFEAVRELGFSAVSVSTGEDPAVPGRHGLRFYLDQAAGKGVLELREEVFGPLRDAYQEGRRAEILHRPACLSDPAVQRRLVETVLGRLAAALPHGPLAVSYGDEVSLTTHANPLDLCFGPHCLAEFRAGLRRRYGRLDALNRAWQTDFTGFDAVRPLTADQIRRRELGGAYLPRNLSPWAAHRAFMDARLARTVEALGRAVERAAPGLARGLTGLQPPSAYGGHDYAALLPGLSFYEAYDVGGARSLAEALAPPGARQVLTLFPPATGQPLEMVRGQVVDALAHGLWGVVVWSAGTVFGEGLRPSPFGRELARVFTAERRVARRFAGAEVRRSPVWIVESQSSVRAWWMLDSAADGATWIRRLSSYEAAHSTSLAARHGWVRLCQDLGVTPSMVPEDQLARAPRERPRLIVLPACIALSDAAVRALTSYVAQGGVLVADHTPAFYDQDLVLRERPGLDEVFGVGGRTLRWSDLKVRDGRAEGPRLPTGAAVAEQGLSAELGEPVGEDLVQLEHVVELGGSGRRGRAFYLNLAVGEYGRVRLDPDPEATAVAVDLRRRLRHVFDRARVRAPVVVSAVSGTGLPALVERVELRGRDGRRLLAVRLNALESPELVRTLAARGPQRVRLLFSAEVRPFDLRRGVDLGVGTRFELDLDPVGGLFLELRPER